MTQSNIKSQQKTLDAHERLVHVIQGEYKVSNDPYAVMTTLLGSCIAVCLCDPVSKVGGINHFLLPFGDEKAGDTTKYGAYAMELLINDILKRGGDRRSLEAKVFGGARLISGASDIGQKNALFARDFLAAEGIECISESVGGEQARRIRYWPTTGRARQLLIRAEEAKIREERPAPPPLPVTNDVELF